MLRRITGREKWHNITIRQKRIEILLENENKN